MAVPRTLLKELSQRPDPVRTLDLLKALAAMPLAGKDLAAFHEHLLFGKAYPRSAEIFDFCNQELKRFEKRIAGLNKNDREESIQTGMAGTTIFYPYDYETAIWLYKRLKKNLDVDWDAYAEREDDPLAEYLPLFMLRTESDATDDESSSTREIIETARGRQHETSLSWILDGFERAFPDGIRQHLYDKMQLLLKVDLVSQEFSRTTLDDDQPAHLFIWNPAETRTSFGLISEIKRPLEIPPPVDPQRGRELLNLALGALLPRLRELYPATHGNPAEVYDIPLERGIRVIVWFMRPEFRLPLEAGWGLLLLKNHVPIGYGAGGMLAERSEIAINIFDTFRGGEAAWLYAQYARIFRTFCGAPWLVTRKYQIGYENEEGIASGAYWFWDKLGFRSTDKAIRKLADQERRKITKLKGYRSSRRILKQLCQADIVLSLNGEPPETYHEYPLGAVGLLAVQSVARELDGNRHQVEKRMLDLLKDRLNVSTDHMTPHEKSALAQMGLFLLAIPDFGKWPVRDRDAAIELCRFKGSAREADYARVMRHSGRFFSALQKISQK